MGGQFSQTIRSFYRFRLTISQQRKSTMQENIAETICYCKISKLCFGPQEKSFD